MDINVSYLSAQMPYCHFNTLNDSCNNYSVNAKIEIDIIYA